MKRESRDRRKEAPVRQRSSFVHREDIARCENQEEYEQLVREHSRLYVPWAEHVAELRKERRLHIYQIAKGCELAGNTVSQFLRKIPTKREYVIMLAAMLELDVEQTDNLLTRWAKFQGLYAKNPADAIWIYILSRGCGGEPARMFREYQAVYQEELEQFRGGTPRKNTLVLRGEIVDSAREAAASSPAEDQVYRRMVRGHLEEYQTGYDKLMRYLEKLMDEARESFGSPNEMFSGNKHFKDNYYEKMRELRRDHVLPSRTFLITLALRLNMDCEAIDELLAMAGMGPMCAKDRVEGSMVFFLEELYCACPSVFFNFKRNGSDPVYYDLHESGSENDLIRRSDDDESVDETLNEYIKRRMTESGLSLEGDEAERAREFLKML